MAEEIDLSGIPLAEEEVLPQDSINLDEIDLSGIPLAEEQPVQADVADPVGFDDILIANAMRGISNSVTMDPVSNFETIKGIVPQAELREIIELDPDGKTISSPVIYVPDPDTQEMVPLSQAGGTIGAITEGVGESIRPIAGVAATAGVGALAGTKIGAALGVPGMIAGGLIGAALTSLLGTSAFDAAMTTVGGVKDKRNTLEKIGDIAEEFSFDVAGGKVFEALPSALKNVAKSPFKAAKGVVNFLSKFGLAPKPEQLSIAKSMKDLQGSIGTKNAKEILRIMDENEVPYPLALEVLSENRDIRGFLETTMKNPFGRTLYNLIEDARIRTEAQAFKIPQRFKEGKPLTREEVGGLVGKEVDNVFTKRQEVQSRLRDKFQKNLQDTIVRQRGKKEVPILDIAEEIKEDAGEFIATPLGENKSYRKIDNFLKKKVMIEKTSEASKLNEDSFSSVIMDLEIPGEEAQKAIKESFNREYSGSSKVDINDLFEIEKSARDAYRKRFLGNGAREDELSSKLKRFRNKISIKLNREIENLSPSLRKQKQEYDAQWARDTEIIEKGVGKFQQQFRNPEEIVDIAKEQAKIGGTRLRNIKKGLTSTNKEVWNELRTSILDTMGKSGKDDKHFSLAKWNNEYSSFSPEAKEVLFGDVPGLVKKLDEFSELALLAKERRLNTNPSGTSQAEGFRMALERFVTSPLKQIGISTGNYLASNLMASPKFVGIIADGINPKNLKVITENGLRTVRYKDPNFEKKLLRRLAGLAVSNATLREPINKFINNLQDKLMYQLSDLNKEIDIRLINRPNPQAEMLGTKG